MRRPAPAVRTLRTAALTLVTALTALTALTGCTPGTGTDGNTLTVGFVVDPSWAQVPVAERLGYFSEEGLDVRVVNFSTGVEALQALQAGQVDVTTAGDVPTAAAVTRDPAVRVVADGSRWNGSRIVARRDAGVSTLADLQGRRIGTPSGTTAAYYVARALEQAGVQAELVQVAPSAMVTAAIGGDVDAVSVFQPYQAQVQAALGDGAVSLDGGDYSQHSLYLAHAGTVTARDAALRAFTRALDRAGADLRSGSPAALDAVATATQLSPQLLTGVLAEFDFTVTLSDDLAPELRRLADWARAQGRIDAQTPLPDYAPVLEPRFVTASGG